MTPDTQALQVFYGTIPLVLTIGAAFFRSQLVLKDILERLRSVEVTLASIDKRLVALETRAGVIHQ